MKQIQSIFLEDEDYEELVKIKELKGWSWKDLLLFHIGKERGDKEGDNGY
jgi:predicted CopG family antitoxin